MILKSPLYSWQVSRCSHYWNWVSNWHKDIYHDSWTQGTHSVAGCTVSGWDEPLWQRKDPRESGTCQGRWCIWIFWGHSWHYQILQGCNLQQNWKEDTLCYPIFDSRFVKHVCQLNCTILDLSVEIFVWNSYRMCLSLYLIAFVYMYVEESW